MIFILFYVLYVDCSLKFSLSLRGLDQVNLYERTKILKSNQQKKRAYKYERHWGKLKFVNKMEEGN